MIIFKSKNVFYLFVDHITNILNLETIFFKSGSNEPFCANAYCNGILVLSHQM